MNKLLFSQGGQPVYLDDLDFLQQTMRESLSYFLQAFGDCILSGCEFTRTDNNSISWTEGVISYKGELFKVPAGSGASNSLLQSGIAVSILRTPAEKRVFGDGTEHDTRELGTAQFTVKFQPGREEVFIYPPFTGNRFADVLRSFVGGSRDILPVSSRYVGRSTMSRTLTRYSFPPALNIIKGQFKAIQRLTNINGMLMNYDDNIGELRGKGLVISPSLPEGAYVSIEGFGIVLYAKDGSRINTVEEGTEILFTIIES